MRLSEVLGTSLVPQEPADDEIADDDAVWLAFATDGAAETVVEPLRGAMRFPVDWLSRLRDRAEPVYEDDPLPRLDALRDLPVRSEQRRVGKGCVSTGRSRWSPFH